MDRARSTTGDSGPFNADTDAYVGGNVSGNTLSITGTLYTPAASTITGKVNYGALVRQPVTVTPPCDCSAGQLIPVGAIVSNRKTTNDNALISLDSMMFLKANPPQRLDLPCGNYYLDGINVSIPVAIVAHGNTALYIGGDLVSSSQISLTLDPTAQFDIFIAGTIKSSAGLDIGSPNYPALSRTYVGSAAMLQISSSAAIDGEFYAAYAPVVWSSNVDVYGSVFAGSFTNSAPARIHYDRGVLQAGVDCPPTNGGCGSCRDCNNQACINGACSSCTSSAQCCAPLICVSGRCELFKIGF